MRNQKGFTLIELIIVIVVLGILAVTAAPQFINFSSDARASALKGMEGSVKAAMQLTYSKASVDGLTDSDSATIKVQGNNISLVYGHPAASANGIINAVDGDFADKSLESDWVYEVDASGNLLMAQSSSVSGSGTNGAYAEGNIVSSGCYITYKEATENTTPTPAEISPATVEVSDDTGC